MKQPFDLFSRTNKKLLPQQSRKREFGELPRPRKHEVAIIFIISLIVNLSIAILFNFYWEVGSTKALSTTGNAFYFLYSKNSLLKEILLIDPPLPAFLQLVLIPILNIFRITSFAGPLLSAIGGALSLVMLNQILFLLRLPGKFRWVFLGLVQCFPSFLFASAIGTSETLYLFVVLVVIYGALQIRVNQMAFLICGFGLALGFLVKYEIIALLAGLALALIIFEWNIHENWRKELEGWMLAFLTPPIYGITLWLIFNQLLINSPLYFLNRSYAPDHTPNIALNVGVRHPFFLGLNNFFEAIAIAFSRTWQLSLIFIIGIFLVTYLSFAKRKRHYISVLIMLLSIPTMLTLEVFLGILPSWIYLWMAVIPFGAVLMGMIYQDIKPKWRDYLMISVMVLMLLSIYLNFNMLNDWGASLGEQRAYYLVSNQLQEEQRLRMSDPYWVVQHDAPIIARALDQYADEGLILMDNAYASPIAFNVEKSDQLLIVENMTYRIIFEQAAQGAAYVLIMNTNQPLNEMTAPQESPTIAEDAGWASEIWSSDETILDWRLYQLNIDVMFNP